MGFCLSAVWGWQEENDVVVPPEHTMHSFKYRYGEYLTKLLDEKAKENNLSAGKCRRILLVLERFELKYMKGNPANIYLF